MVTLFGSVAVALLLLGVGCATRTPTPTPALTRGDVLGLTEQQVGAYGDHVRCITAEYRSGNRIWVVTCRFAAKADLDAAREKLRRAEQEAALGWPLAEARVNVYSKALYRIHSGEDSFLEVTRTYAFDDATGEVVQP